MRQRLPFQWRYVGGRALDGEQIHRGETRVPTSGAKSVPCVRVPEERRDPERLVEQTRTSQ